MPARGADGRFVRDEGLNFNISIFTILKYLIVFAAIFPWYKLIEKTEILNIFYTSYPAGMSSMLLPIGKLNRKPNWKTQLNKFKFIYLLLNLDLLIFLYIFWIIKPHRTTKAPVAIQNKSVVALRVNPLAS